MSARKPDGNSHEDRVRRENSVKEALDFLQGQEKPLSDEDKIVDEAMNITRKVHRAFEQQVRATPSLRFNKIARAQWLGQAFTNEFRHLDKERLLFLVAMLHTEALLGQM